MYGRNNLPYSVKNVVKSVSPLYAPGLKKHNDLRLSNPMQDNTYVGMGAT